jgi:hypothetical protein
VTRIDLTTRDLHGLIAPVLPHVSTDPELPLLNALHIEISGGVLYCAATDRFTLAVTRHLLDDVADDVTILVDRADAAAMLKLFTFTKDDDPELTIIIDQVTVPAGAKSYKALAWRVDASDGTRLVLHDRSVAGVERPMKNWRALVGAALHRPQKPASPTLILTPSFLPRWAKAAGKGERLTAFIGPEPTDPILVTVEQHFVGLWMPVNHLDADGRDLLEGNPWRDEIAEVTS